MTDKDFISYLNNLEDKSQVICYLNFVTCTPLGFPPEIERKRVTFADVVDLINRLKAEDERLKFNLKSVLDERADHTDAIKEYKNKVESDIVTLLGKSNCTNFVECLDYRYKEMVGEDK